MGTDGQYYPEDRICVRNNTNQKSAYLDADHDFKGLSIGADLFNCELGKIKSIKF
jgi:hypothetical protein